MNDGLLAPDRSPHPHLAEVKKVYQPVRFHLLDRSKTPTSAGLLFAVENRFDFITLAGVELRVDLSAVPRGGAEAGEAAVGLALGVDGSAVMPGERHEFQVDLRKGPHGPGQELLLTFCAVLKSTGAEVRCTPRDVDTTCTICVSLT